MSRQKFYCSSCGIELKQYPKAIPGKGTIVNMVDPHDCLGYFTSERPDGKQTVIEMINELKPISGIIPNDKKEETPIFFGLSDKRKDAITTAPTGLLDNLKSMRGGDVE